MMSSIYLCRMIRLIVLFILIIKFSSTLGQILNVEKRRGAVVENGWHGNIDFQQSIQKTLNLYLNCIINQQLIIKKIL